MKGLRMWRRYTPTFLVATVMIALPAAQGGIRGPNYSLADQYDHFTLAFDALVPLLFFLLASLLYGLFFVQELSAGAWLPIQARQGMRRYMLSHLRRAAFTGFVIGLLMVILVGILTLWAVPRFGWVTYYPEGGGPPAVERSTVGALIPLGDVWFCLIYAAWVGIYAALCGMFTVLALMHVNNKLLALAVVPITVFVFEFITAVLGFPRLGIGVTVFGFNMQQGPLWIPLAVTLVLSAGLLALTFAALDRRRLPAVFS